MRTSPCIAFGGTRNLLFFFLAHKKKETKKERGKTREDEREREENRKPLHTKRERGSEL
jgi:hypothetical protein